MVGIIIKVGEGNSKVEDGEANSKAQSELEVAGKDKAEMVGDLVL